MSDWAARFLESFLPLFVAIDPFGLLPIFLAVTEGHSSAQRRRICFEAVAAATVVSISFMFLGDALFHFLGISGADFKIAGGIILLVLSVVDLLMSGKPAVHEREMVGVVPLGMPLIAGPATLTTILVSAGRPEQGYALTAAALAANFAILLAVLLAAERIARIVGVNTLRALSKLVMVLLAAIAVSFIRWGFVEMGVLPGVR